MAIIDSPYLGSFQKGIHMTSEDLLEDVWESRRLYGSEEFLRENVTSERHGSLGRL